jgi:pimeloyl-ACP methyl ester carboxylesterase
MPMIRLQGYNLCNWQQVNGFVQEGFIFCPLNYSKEDMETVQVQYHHIQSKKPNGSLIVYCHGNASLIAHCAAQLSFLTDNGYGILLVEYRGYGKNWDLAISEESMCRDTLRILNQLLESHTYTNVVAMGRSMGTGVASFLARQDDRVRGCILISPFLNLGQVCRDFVGRYIGTFVERFLLRFHFPTDKNVAAFSHRCRLLLLHGDKDDLIELQHSKELYLLAREDQAKLVVLQGRCHNVSYQDPLLRSSIINFLSQVCC